MLATIAAWCGCAGTTPSRESRPARFEREVDGPLVEDAPLDPDLAATDAAADAIAWIDQIAEEMRVTRYQGRTEVIVEEGYYAWDCSGMVGWILRRTAPRAFGAVGSRRPLARDFYRAIARAPSNRPSRGWQRVDSIEDVRPGDVFALPRSATSDTDETGHVGFVVSVPEREGALPHAFAMRVADATAVPHADDTRDEDGAGGFGFGTMVVMLDETGDAIGYLWAGPDGPELTPALVLFGRVHR